MTGLVLQWIGAVLIAMGILAPRRGRAVARRCRFIGPTLWATVTHECWQGEHRGQLIGWSVAAVGLGLVLFGRHLAKQAGLD